MLSAAFNSVMLNIHGMNFKLVDNRLDLGNFKKILYVMRNKI